jgi:hypothetical protein
VTIPLKIQRITGIARTWTINEIIGEIRREPGHRTHINAPIPPKAVYGIDSSALRAAERVLYQQADTQMETYVRRGMEHRRKVRKTTPILLVAAASYPDLLTEETEERRRWQRLVIDAARERWGDKVLAVLGHEDEPHYHLHILVHNYGASAKPLHFGHASAMGLLGPMEAKNAGEAYREGGRAAQDWFHNRVGRPMGWERQSSAPRPRHSRPHALALRELALADKEAEVNERERVLRQKEAEWEAHHQTQVRRAIAAETARHVAVNANLRVPENNRAPHSTE